MLLHIVYTFVGYDHSVNTGAIAGGLIGGFFILIVVVALIVVGLIVSNNECVQIYLHVAVPYMYVICTTGKAVRLSNGEKQVAYEEPNLSQPVPKKDPGVELEQCPAYGVVQ